MAASIHFFPQFPQGNLDMPLGAAVRLPVSGGNFFLFLLRQPR